MDFTSFHFGESFLGFSSLNNEILSNENNSSRSSSVHNFEELSNTGSTLSNICSDMTTIDIEQISPGVVNYGSFLNNDDTRSSLNESLNSNSSSQPVKKPRKPYTKRVKVEVEASENCTEVKKRKYTKKEGVKEKKVKVKKPKKIEKKRKAIVLEIDFLYPICAHKNFLFATHDTTHFRIRDFERNEMIEVNISESETVSASGFSYPKNLNNYYIEKVRTHYNLYNQYFNNIAPYKGMKLGQEFNLDLKNNAEVADPHDENVEEYVTLPYLESPKVKKWSETLPSDFFKKPCYYNCTDNLKTYTIEDFNFFIYYMDTVVSNPFWQREVWRSTREFRVRDDDISLSLALSFLDLRETDGVKLVCELLNRAFNVFFKRAAHFYTFLFPSVEKNSHHLTRTLFYIWEKLGTDEKEVIYLDNSPHFNYEVLALIAHFPPSKAEGLILKKIYPEHGLKIDNPPKYEDLFKSEVEPSEEIRTPKVEYLID